MLKTTNQTRDHAFLIAVELEDTTSPEDVSNKLAGSLTWVEGVGKVDVEHLGEITSYNEDEALSE